MEDIENQRFCDKKRDFEIAAQLLRSEKTNNNQLFSPNPIQQTPSELAAADEEDARRRRSGILAAQAWLAARSRI